MHGKFKKVRVNWMGEIKIKGLHRGSKQVLEKSEKKRLVNRGRKNK